MKRIEAVIRPEKLDPLRLSLESINHYGLTVTRVEGHGKQQGVTRQWRGRQYRVDLLPKVKVEVIVPDPDVKKIVEMIFEICRTGEVGDGKIFVTDLANAYRIRTGEDGNNALL
jgi:nitrogen regulatory protein P-II 1